MPKRLLGIFWHQTLKFGLSLLVLEMRLVGSRKDRGKFRPSIRRGHIDNPHSLKPRFRWLDAEQLGLLAALDTTPELAFGRDDQMLVQRIAMGQDFDPFAAAGNHRKHRG